MADTDAYQLSRFLDAQEGVYPQALAELKAGRKRTHWMWFVFPQLRGLGRSPSAVHYAIGSLAEAQAYLAHPVLGARLREAAATVFGLEQGALTVIFGSPDDLKFCSSMTLFSRASIMEDNIFSACLERFCGGRDDAATLALLSDSGPARLP